MATVDPLQSIRDAIDHLEEASAPIEAEIQQVRAEANKRITELEASVVEHRLELARWRRALARAEGTRSEEASARISRRGAGPLASDARLRGALDGHRDGLSASEVRAALSIEADVPAATVTRFLGDAVARGVIKRTGERRGTRYSTR